MDIGHWFVVSLSVLLPLLEIAGIVAAVHAVMYGRTSQGSVGWAVALVSFPLVSLPLYAAFGRSRFHGYVRARRAGDSEIQHIAQRLAEEYVPENRIDFGSSRPRYAALERLAKMPFTRNNRARLLIDGDAAFEAIFAGIESAREYILVQFFIVREDDLGRELKRRLIERARQGVAVHFLFDGIGSRDLPGAYIEELREAGVEIEAFNPGGDRRSRFQVNFRNHRKIVVVDGIKTYVGGLNVGIEYLGHDPKLSPWRDTHIELEGPAAIAAQLTFIEDWYWVTRRLPKLTWWPRHLPDHDQRILVLPSGPADESETCGLFFMHMANIATERIWIVSPYFVPDNGLMNALKLAALRGVDVRILVPNKPDHLLVYLAAQAYFPEAVDAGVGIYLYREGFLHQKVALVDDDLATVGTANLDNRSFRLNFEITVVGCGAPMTSDVEAMLRQDFEHSRRITAEDVEKQRLPLRVLSRIARLFSPIL